MLDRIADTHRALVIDFSAVPFLDSTAANTIAGMVSKARRQGVRVSLTGTRPEARRMLFAHGIRPPDVSYEPSVPMAVSKARSAIAPD